MQELQLFNFGNAEIRTILDEDGVVLFVAKDIAEALGYARPNDAVNDYCDGTSIYRPIQDSLNRTQNVRVYVI